MATGLPFDRQADPVAGRHEAELVAEVAKGGAAALFLGLCGVAQTLLLLGGNVLRPTGRARRQVNGPLPCRQRSHIGPMRGDGSRLQ